MDKPSVIKITDALPEEAITAPLGVAPRSIRLARERGVFPASWFTTVRDACLKAGIECPETAFNWKTTQNSLSTKYGSADPCPQDNLSATSTASPKRVKTGGAA